MHNYNISLSVPVQDSPRLAPSTAPQSSCTCTGWGLQGSKPSRNRRWSPLSARCPLRGPLCGLLRGLLYSEEPTFVVFAIRRSCCPNIQSPFIGVMGWMSLYRVSVLCTVLDYAAVRFAPETGMRHKPHAEVKMAAKHKP